MKRRLSQILKTPTVPLLLATMTACSSEEPPVRKKAQEGNKPPAADGTGASANDLAKVAPRPPLSVALNLDTAEFRINGLRVGLQDFMSSSAIAVTSLMPPQADYLEVMRCASSTVIRGTTDNLSDLELGAKSVADETRIMLANDFWTAAVNAGCLLITADTTDKVLIDAAAPSGSYRYVARACAALERLPDAKLYSNRNCSRQVTMSTNIDFQNARIADERRAVEEMQRSKDTAAALGRQLYTLTVDLNNALVECKERQADLAAAAKRKSAIATILNAGVSLGGQYLTSLNETAQNSDGTGLTTLSVGSALTNLFTQSQQLPTSCTAAEEIKKQAATSYRQLEATKKLFDTQVAKVETFKTMRQNVEQQP